MDSCIAWLTERLASGSTLTAQIRPSGTRGSAARFAMAKQDSSADGAYRWIVSQTRFPALSPERRVIVFGYPGLIAKVIEHVV